MSRRYSNPASRSHEKTRTCACGKPTRDQAYICESCLDGVTDDLHELAPSDDDSGLWLNFRSAVAGERGIDYRSLGRGGSSGPSEKGLIETGIVLDDTAVQRGEQLAWVLRRMVVACTIAKVESAAPEGWTPRAADEVLRTVEWLSWRVSGMAWHPQLAKAPDALTKAVDGLRRTVMPAPFRQWLGLCPTVDCPGTMRATRDETFATCDRCGEHLEAQPLREWLISYLIDEHCTAAEIADLYDPDPAVRLRVRKRINQWASRGHLLGWPRVCDWKPGVCAWPAPSRGRNYTSPTEPLVFRFGDAFDLLVQDEDQHDTTTNTPRSS